MNEQQIVNATDITISTLVDLSKKRALLKKLARKMQIDDTQKLISALQAGLQLAEEDELKRMERDAEKESAAKEIAEKMMAAGITMEEVVALTSGKKNPYKSGPGAKIEPKYRILVDGKTHEWTGRGRTPVVFAEHFETHNLTKDDVAI